MQTLLGLAMIVVISFGTAHAAPKLKKLPAGQKIVVFANFLPDLEIAQTGPGLQSEAKARFAPLANVAINRFVEAIFMEVNAGPRFSFVASTDVLPDWKIDRCDVDEDPEACPPKTDYKKFLAAVAKRDFDYAVVLEPILTEVGPTADATGGNFGLAGALVGIAIAESVNSETEESRVTIRNVTFHRERLQQRVKDNLDRFTDDRLVVLAPMKMTIYDVKSGDEMETEKTQRPYSVDDGPDKDSFFDVSDATLAAYLPQVRGAIRDAIYRLADGSGLASLVANPNAVDFSQSIHGSGGLDAKNNFQLVADQKCGNGKVAQIVDFDWHNEASGKKKVYGTYFCHKPD